MTNMMNHEFETMYFPAQERATQLFRKYHKIMAIYINECIIPKQKELWKCTLPETNSSPLKIGAPWKRRFLLETTHFQGLLLLVSGRVSLSNNWIFPLSWPWSFAKNVLTLILMFRTWLPRPSSPTWRRHFFSLFGVDDSEDILYDSINMESPGYVIPKWVQFKYFCGFQVAILIDFARFENLKIM